jgi:hypothetical protein
MKVRVPADTDLPDTLVAGLTAHQLLLTAPGVATVLVGGLLLTPGIVPVWTALVGLVVVAVSIGVVLTNPDGMTYDRFVIARLRHRRASRLEVMVQPPSDLPVWVAAAQQPEKAVGLDLPWGGLDHEVPALVPLGRDESGSELGEALVLALSPLDVRSMDEGEVARSWSPLSHGSTRSTARRRSLFPHAPATTATGVSISSRGRPIRVPFPPAKT